MNPPQTGVHEHKLTQTDQKSLENFFGIGPATSARIMARFYIHPTCKVAQLANKQVLDLTAALSEMRIENDLRRKVLDDIKRMRETGSNRGRRHALGLPVRGQRSQNNVCFFFPWVWDETGGWVFVGANGVCRLIRLLSLIGLIGSFELLEGLCGMMIRVFGLF